MQAVGTSSGRIQLVESNAADGVRSVLGRWAGQLSSRKQGQGLPILGGWERQCHQQDWSAVLLPGGQVPRAARRAGPEGRGTDMKRAVEGDPPSGHRTAGPHTCRV